MQPKRTSKSLTLAVLALCLAAWSVAPGVDAQALHADVTATTPAGDVDEHADVVLHLLPTNTPSKDAALVLVDPSGAIGTADLALRPGVLRAVGGLVPLPDDTFPLVVGALPAGVAKVQVYGHGDLLDEQDVDILEDGASPVYATSVHFPAVPSLRTNDYTVRLLDGLGGQVAESGALELLTADPAAAGLAPVPGANVPFGPVPPEAAACTPISSYTWATESGWFYNSNDYGNAYNVNAAKMLDMELGKQWTTGMSDNCGGSTQIGGAHPWGVGVGIEGKTKMVGTGTYNWGFSLSYGGGGSSWYWDCRGGTCVYEGYEVGVSNAQAIMRTPSTASPVWNHLQNVNIPATSGTTVPTTLAKLALDALSASIGGWGGVLVTAIGYAVPSKITWQNYAEKTNANGDGGSAGGINVNTYVTGKKLVSGEMSWRFNGYGSFVWGMQAAVQMRGQFRACYSCNFIDSGYVAWLDRSHNAQVTTS